MVNNSLDLQQIESNALNRYYTVLGYGQIILDLDAIMAGRDLG